MRLIHGFTEEHKDYGGGGGVGGGEFISLSYFSHRKITNFESDSYFCLKCLCKIEKL